jgi:hypothetical protein
MILNKFEKFLRDIFSSGMCSVQKRVIFDSQIIKSIKCRPRCSTRSNRQSDLASPMIPFPVVVKHDTRPLQSVFVAADSRPLLVFSAGDDESVYCSDDLCVRGS